MADGERNGAAGAGDTAWLLPHRLFRLGVECGKEIRQDGDLFFVYLFNIFQMSFSMRIA